MHLCSTKGRTLLWTWVRIRSTCCRVGESRGPKCRGSTPCYKSHSSSSHAAHTSLSHNRQACRNHSAPRGPSCHTTIAMSGLHHLHPTVLRPNWVSFTSSTARNACQLVNAAGPASAISMPLPLSETITSTSNAYIKHCVKLRDSNKYRQQQRRLLLVGLTLIRELTGGHMIGFDV